MAFACLSGCFSRCTLNGDPAIGFEKVSGSRDTLRCLGPKGGVSSIRRAHVASQMQHCPQAFKGASHRARQPKQYRGRSRPHAQNTRKSMKCRSGMLPPARAPQCECRGGIVPPMPCNARIGTIDRNVGAACCRPHAQNTRKSMNREPACCRLHAPRNANVGAACCRPHPRNANVTMGAPYRRPHAQNTRKSMNREPACCRPHARNANVGAASCRPCLSMRGLVRLIAM